MRFFSIKIDVKKRLIYILLLLLSFSIYSCGYSESDGMKAVTLSYNNSQKLEATSAIQSNLAQVIWNIKCPKILPNENNWEQTYTTPTDKFYFQIPNNKECDISLNSVQASDGYNYVPDSDYNKLVLHLDKTGNAKLTAVYSYYYNNNVIAFTAYVKDYALMLENTPVFPAAIDTKDKEKTIHLMPLKIAIDSSSMILNPASYIDFDVDCPDIFHGQGWVLNNFITVGKDIGDPKCETKSGICLPQGEKCNLTLNNYYVTDAKGYEYRFFPSNDYLKLVLVLTEQGLIEGGKSTSISYYFFDKNFNRINVVFSASSASQQSNTEYSIKLKFILGTP